MNIKLSDHFTCGKLVWFALPTIGMILVSTTYDLIDGYFVSNYIGKTAFAAINIIYPYLLAIMAVGMMFGVGGSALIAAELGKGDRVLANRYFTMIVKAAFGAGVVLGAAGLFALPTVSELLGATEDMMGYGLPYGRVLLCFMPIAILSYAFQSLLITAEKPQFGLYFSLINMGSNIIFDWLFIVVFGWGMTGAALATAIGMCLNGILPLVYFLRENTSPLRLVKKSGWDIGPLLGAMGNGSSEMVTNVSTALIFIFYNMQLMRFIGEDGVAAYGTVLFVEGIFAAIFYGLAMEATSVVGYHAGAQNYDELQSLLKKGVMLNLGCGIVMFGSAQCFAPLVAEIYLGYDAELCALGIYALRMFAFAFILQGFNEYASAYFTGLGNGRVSAAIAFMRTFVLQSVAIFGLPMILGTDGLWFAQTFAEVVSTLVAVVFLVKFRHEFMG
ncbi:MATE family efflux transporter [uncultured Anaerovibrio sp.]|uniref:MATE family efflux transporter n=1 Tax=uncultured Anaerovibrio sp. TaxID=361586 RepID=UPI0025F3A397|nr:MATE family efflux transporter [uncultured Anaerovibrio sp.]